jgi:hypothetical protein
MISLEIVRCFGTHCTKGGLQTHFVRDINPNARAIVDHLRQGGDPKDLVMRVDVRSNKLGNGTASCLCPCLQYHEHNVLSFSVIFKHQVFTQRRAALRSYFHHGITHNIQALRNVANGDDPTNVVITEF